MMKFHKQLKLLPLMKMMFQFNGGWAVILTTGGSGRKERIKVVEEKFPRNAIIKSGIVFTSTKRLNKATISELKELYNKVEFI